jgi:hypothetical protein
MIIPLRKWATPLTIGAFFLMAVTGVLMFFHIDRGLISGAHEWLSWLFLIGVTAHVIANFRPFMNSLKSGWGRTSVSVFGAVLVASLFTWGAHTGGQFLAALQKGLVSVPLTSLAVMTHTEPHLLEHRLHAHGIAARREQTIRDIAGESPRKQLQILEIVFLP